MRLDPGRTGHGHARWLAWPALLAAILAALMPYATLAEHAGGTHGGQATAIDVNVTVAGLTTVDATLCATEPLPEIGGNVECEVATAAIPGVLTAALLQADSSGTGVSSTTTSSVAEVDVSIGGGVLVDPTMEVTAELLASTAMASCTVAGSALSGESTITDLVITVGGQAQPIAVTGEPNQTVAVTVGTITGTIVINEQTEQSALDGQSGEITVNALRITLVDTLTATEISLLFASSHAAIACAAAPPSDGPTGAPPTDAPPSDAPPTGAPSVAPPSDAPSEAPPTDTPSDAPPTDGPSDAPPTDGPSDAPPTDGPTDAPPTAAPTDAAPTNSAPTRAPATDALPTSTAEPPDTARAMTLEPPNRGSGSLLLVLLFVSTAGALLLLGPLRRDPRPPRA